MHTFQTSFWIDFLYYRNKKIIFPDSIVAKVLDVKYVAPLKTYLQAV